MTKVISFDCPDYGGKTTLVEQVASILTAAGYRVRTFNFPRNDSRHGQDARNAVLKGESADIISVHMVADFQATLSAAYLSGSYDFILCDRFAASTIVYQGDVGKEIVMQSGVHKMTWAPTVYVALDVDYSTAVQRAQKRMAEKGKSWDDEVLTAKYLQNPEAWNGLRERYRFAHHILTEGGTRARFIHYTPIGDPREDLMNLTAQVIR